MRGIDAAARQLLDYSIVSKLLNAGLVLGASSLLACRVLVDPGITYCSVDLNPYIEPFDDGRTIKALQAHCWRFDQIMLEKEQGRVADGDLILRGAEPASKADNWLGAEQGPMAFEEVKGDFVVVTRVEALEQIQGNQCLQPGNLAGLFARAPGGGGEWVTLLIGPFTPAPNPGDLSCDGTTPNPFPTMAVAASRDNASGDEIRETGANQAGVGLDGEVDLAMCRVGAAIAFYYRDPASTPEIPVWRQVGGDGAQPYHGGREPLEVGVTVAGANGDFGIEGHFSWIEYDRVGVDGCGSTLETITLPP